MLTPADIKPIIINNFNDDRIFAIQSFIARLLERKTFSIGIDQYRIINTNTGLPITNLTDFVNFIDPAKLVVHYHYQSEKMTGDRTHPFIVKLGNYEIKLSEYDSEDAIYYNMFSRDSKFITFTMNYLADGDTILPLKIIEVKLTA